MPRDSYGLCPKIDTIQVSVSENADTQLTPLNELYRTHVAGATFVMSITALTDPTFLVL